MTKLEIPRIKTKVNLFLANLVSADNCKELELTKFDLLNLSALGIFHYETMKIYNNESRKSGRKTSFGRGT